MELKSKVVLKEYQKFVGNVSPSYAIKIQEALSELEQIENESVKALS